MLAQILYAIKRPFHFVKTGLLEALPAEIKYRFPAHKLKIICITGTDGKTTSSTLLYQVLKQAGKKVALLSTVAAYIGDEAIDTGFHVTTPSPKALQSFMARMVREGYEYLVLEATSHGIYQHRLWGIKPMIVGITNITMEHLDYHLTHDRYVAAKALLALKADTVVINADDEMSFGKLKKILQPSRAKVVTYSTQYLLPDAVQKTIKGTFKATYNWMNSRLVYAIAQELGVSDKDYIAAVKDFEAVPGRMQVLPKQHGVTVIIDFAHTPNALEEVLGYLHDKKGKGKLIAVFGCAGLRDWKKRPAMGRIGAELADLAVFTSEDPRTEDIWHIVRQMKQDLGDYYDKVLTIVDRKAAIEFAITKLAQPGDTVGIFGKGHERSMCFGTTEYPWSDEAAAQAALEMRST